MSPEEILKRLEEIEADAARGISNPDTDVWLYQVVRGLMAECMEMRHFVEIVAEEEDNPSLAFPQVISMAQRLLWKLACGADIGADLLAYLHKLEEVAEAARKLKKMAVIVSPMHIGAETSPTTQYVGIPRQQWNRLKKALAALEEDGDAG